MNRCVPKPVLHARRFIEAMEEGKGCVFADGYDDALVGHVETPDGVIAVYDALSVIAILGERNSMEPEDAWDFFAYNIAGAYLGPRSPLFLWRFC